MALNNKAGTGQAPLLITAGRGQHGFGNGTDPNVGKKTQFKKGQSGNPAGMKKGTKHLSTTIREMLNDETFIERLAAKIQDKTKLPDPEFQGTPLKAIVSVAMIEAMDPTSQAQPRNAARDWLAKFGYGTKVDITTDDQPLVNPLAELTADDLRKLARGN